MTVIIDKKIISAKVVDETKPTPAETTTIVVRPPVLAGKTYKIKPPSAEHALYVTINDKDGQPFEIFLNTKDSAHVMWTMALTRVISAILRKGGDISFLADELGNVSDPNGGYFSASRFVPSLVSEIGAVLKKHTISSGDKPIETVNKKTWVPVKPKTLCKACKEIAVVVEGGCAKCLSCGDSKCG